MTILSKRIEKVIANYHQNNLYEKIIGAFTSKMGKSENDLTQQDFALIGELHTMGSEGTKLLAELAALQKKESILDVGCGIGGPARILAEQYQVNVTGVDVTPEYIQVAKKISDYLGLDNPSFLHIDDQSLPVDAASFDVAWTQHVQMNVADKQQFYSEIFKALRPKGRLVYFDIFSEDENVLYPVPWAVDPSTSFLITHEELDRILKQVGFVKKETVELSNRALSWFEQFFQTVQSKQGNVLGPQLLMGENASLKIQNLFKNIQSGYCTVAAGLYYKI